MSFANFQGNGRPSTLADVLRQVKQAFDAFGDGTPIMIGRKYLERGVGCGPRIVFVPEYESSISDPLWMGNAASWAHSCDVYVRAPEGRDDIDRFNEAYKLADLVIDCIKTTAFARIEFGRAVDHSPTNSDGFGAEIKLSFTYARDVLHDARRWRLPPSSEDGEVYDDGSSYATGVEVNATTTPKE